MVASLRDPVELELDDEGTIAPALEPALEPAVADAARHLGKRLFDVVVAATLLVLTLPVLLVCALAVRLGDGGPAIFRQQRVGLAGREFTMVKLRTMVADAERLVLDLTDRNISDGLLFKVEADPRVTTVGRWLRRTCLDELPQLWNVLRGDMSLVGPRPLPVRPDEFTGRDGLRHAVRPGLTGPWQVAGGPRIPYRQMIDLDLAYIEGWTLRRDLALLARTVPAVCGRAHW